MEHEDEVDAEGSAFGNRGAAQTATDVSPPSGRNCNQAMPSQELVTPQPLNYLCTVCALRLVTVRRMGLLTLERLPLCLVLLIYYFRYFFVFLYPLALLPVVLINTNNITKSAYILLWMSGYWITGVVPLYATALLPMFAGPLMGLQTSGTLSREYLPTSNFLFIASMFLAGAAEHCNLHRRVVIFCLKCMGGDPRLILLGIMIPTWFLSLWMSNSATTLLMVTITETLLNRIDEVTKSIEGSVEEDDSTTKREFKEDGSEKLSPNRSKWQKFGVGLSLSVCYSASCGGMGTLTGTPTNIVVYNLLTE
ncbi:unnamed protein product [Hydatigera taeniaeformis]|uniref:Solute carrier family 13 member 5-like n=1 Tax=Hydatigena taeniaeformis TaxID=6205 RepID=A0A0R3WQU9_HYDTA|nr:unnamed protein product [Hydatigera taeniaeformis]